MQPTEFKSQWGRPVVMKAPEGMDNCQDLHTVLITQDSLPIRVSKWILSDEELEKIKETRAVYLLIYGMIHPPVSVTAIPPIPETAIVSEL